MQAGEDGQTVVSAIDPLASMQAVENEAQVEVAEQVKARLRKVIESV